jgi:hypothetical protein
MSITKVFENIILLYIDQYQSVHFGPGHNREGSVSHIGVYL